MERSPQTLVCFAVREEARPFCRLAESMPGVNVLVTGMGRKNAARQTAPQITRSKTSLVITAGFAGGLNPALACGTVIFEADPESGLEARLRAAGAVPARFHCADRVAITAAEKLGVRNETGADAIEMESAVIRELCRQRDVPGATVRVVLDPADQDLPLDFNTLLTEAMEIDGLKLALAVLRSPGNIPALLRFQKQARAAATALALVLHRTLAGQ